MIDPRARNIHCHVYVRQQSSTCQLEILEEEANMLERSYLVGVTVESQKKQKNKRKQNSVRGNEFVSCSFMDSLRGARLIFRLLFHPPRKQRRISLAIVTSRAVIPKIPRSWALLSSRHHHGQAHPDNLHPESTQEEGEGLFPGPPNARWTKAVRSHCGQRGKNWFQFPSINFFWASSWLTNGTLFVLISI